MKDSHRRTSLMGIFSTEAQTASAIRQLRDSAYAIEEAYSPFPSHTIADALQMPKSRVGWFTLAGGIIGFFSGFALAAFTATRWSLIVGGKPVHAWIPFIIVGFEFTILFAVFGNVLGLISQARLPRFDKTPHYDPRFSGHKFGVLASCATDQRGALLQFLEDRGAEIKTVDTPKAQSTGGATP
ncbi:MAG: DUF3341 domain-containing protein [Desulfatitalea sp.]|nr:DUF3341 domain-containing protein [Desulfatitalea sp.]NNK01484.1 DUF3341 domain-containing protein [Desulfatitalea sp.]